MSYRKNRLAHLLTNWRPPAGLRATRPRDVTYTGSGWVVAACMWAAFFGAFAAMVLLGEKADREAAEARLLEQQGVETTGHITRLWRGRGDSKQPYAAFEFTAGGRKFTGRVKVRLSVWRQLSLGDRWNIRYVPSNPRIHHPVPYPPNVTPAVVPYLIGSVC
ncbi:MAG: hypothetical protein JNK48_14760, partial [Bryobacterales bacterium]|nr:hypothetical protein [Bryobacterales bacterium]